MIILDKVKAAIQVTKKYKNISSSLGLTNDERIFNYILNHFLNLIEPVEGNNHSVQTKVQKRNKYGEMEFQSILSNEPIDISGYDLDVRIQNNKDKIIDFWYSLSDDEKNDFTIFELNVILYLISKEYNKYQKKDKKGILSLINTVVKNKRMDNSYNNIIV